MSSPHDSLKSPIRLAVDGPSLPQAQQQQWLLSRVTLAEWLRFLSFLPAYWAAYKYGSLFTQRVAAPFWFPDAVLLCWLLGAARSRWWIYVAASLPIRLLVDTTPAVPLWFLLATYANDSLKGLFSAYVLRRVLGFPVRLVTLRAFTVFVATAAVLAPFFSALGGAAARHALGYGFWSAWYQWFLGDMLASLIITPTLLYWFMSDRMVARRPVELVFLCAGLTSVLYYAFTLPKQFEYPELLCLPLPFLVWAVVRTGPAGTSAALSLLSLLSILSAARGVGIFSSGSASQNTLAIQLFLLVVSAPLLFLAVVMEERRAIQEELRRNRQTLSENYNRIRRLIGRLIHAQEDERSRLARELHDDVGQRLALLQARLSGFAQQLPGAMQAEQVEIGELVSNINEVALDLRDLSRELHPTTLQLLGLRPALTKLCRDVSEEYSIAVKFDDRGDPEPQLSPEGKLCLYRVAQEAMNNAVRHGQAKQIDIELSRDSKTVFMRVQDSGSGFDPGVSSRGLGLVSMEERVRLLGGSLQVNSQSRGGTQVVVQLPFSAASRPKVAS